MNARQKAVIQKAQALGVKTETQQQAVIRFLRTVAYGRGQLRDPVKPETAKSLLYLLRGKWEQIVSSYPDLQGEYYAKQVSALLSPRALQQVTNNLDDYVQDLKAKVNDVLRKA